MIPIKLYAINAPPGPAVLTTSPPATNKPVPMAPPKAIIFMCRDFKLLFNLLFSMGFLLISQDFVHILHYLR